jgi:hypothetical protein
MRKVTIGLIVSLGLNLGQIDPSSSHEWYNGLHDKRGQLCCGADDCEPTHFRLYKGNWELMTRDNRWFIVPTELITFLPVPQDNQPPFLMHDGSPDPDVAHRAHFCYRDTTDADNLAHMAFPTILYGEGRPIVFFCAFIPPQGY